MIKQLFFLALLLVTGLYAGASNLTCGSVSPTIVEDSISTCEHSIVPAFQFTNTNPGNGIVYDIRIYNKDPLLDTVAKCILESNADTFTPNDTLISIGINRFWVSEYDATHECLSTAIPFVLNMQKAPVVTITGESPVLAYSDPLPYQIVPTDSNDVFSWHVSNYYNLSVPCNQTALDLYHDYTWIIPGMDTIIVSETDSTTGCSAFDTLLVQVLRNPTKNADSVIFNVSHGSNKDSLVVITNGRWTATTGANWITTNPTTFLGTDSMFITCLANTSGIARTATITITSRDSVSLKSGTVQTILINQAAGATSEVGIVAANHVTVYPNPASQKLHVKASYDATGVGTVKLCSMQGTVLFQKSLASVATIDETISVSELPAGIYTVVIETADGVKTALVSVER